MCSKQQRQKKSSSVLKKVWSFVIGWCGGWFTAVMVGAKLKMESGIEVHLLTVTSLTTNFVVRCSIFSHHFLSAVLALVAEVCQP